MHRTACNLFQLQSADKSVAARAASANRTARWLGRDEILISSTSAERLLASSSASRWCADFPDLARA